MSSDLAQALLFISLYEIYQSILGAIIVDFEIFKTVAVIRFWYPLYHCKDRKVPDSSLNV